MRAYQAYISEGIGPMRPDEAEWLLSLANRAMLKTKILAGIALVVLPLRRTIPSGEVFFWDGKPGEKPYHADVRIPPAYSVPEPYDGRPLTRDERSELRRKLGESLLLGGGQAIFGMVCFAVQIGRGLPKVQTNSVEYTFMALMSVGLFLMGIIRAYDRKTIRALRDGHAYLDGLEETLAGGRIWRYDGIPAIDRWRVTRKQE